MNTGQLHEPNWKRLLRGGFAFQNATFASHPTDSDFAEQMFGECLAQGITVEEVKAVARDYLQSRGVHPSSIQNQIKLVEKFWYSKRIRTKAKRGWVIFWHFTGDGWPTVERVIAIKDPRIAAHRIREFIREFYAASRFSLLGKMNFAVKSPKLRYPSEPIYSEPPLDFKIECGENPKIIARGVRELEIQNVDGTQFLTWKEIEFSPEIQEHINRRRR